MDNENKTIGEILKDYRRSAQAGEYKCVKCLWEYDCKTTPESRDCDFIPDPYYGIKEDNDGREG